MPPAHKVDRGRAWMYLPPENRIKLRKLILFADSSYRQVAAAAGWSGPSMVAHLVSGRRNSVSDQSALKIAKHLDVNVNDLFTTMLSHEPSPPVAKRAKKTSHVSAGTKSAA